MNKLTEQEKYTVYKTALHISLVLRLLSVSTTFSSKPELYCALYSAFFLSENHFKLNPFCSNVSFLTPYIHYICSSPH